MLLKACSFNFGLHTAPATSLWILLTTHSCFSKILLIKVIIYLRLLTEAEFHPHPICFCRNWEWVAFVRYHPGFQELVCVPPVPHGTWLAPDFRVVPFALRS